MYDVVPAAWFVPSQRRAALPVAERWRIDEIERHHLIDEAMSWAMPEREADDIVSTTLDAIAGAMTLADTRHPSVPVSMRAAVIDQLRRLTAST